LTTRKLAKNRNSAARNIRNDLSDERILSPYFGPIKIAARLMVPGFWERRSFLGWLAVICDVGRVGSKIEPQALTPPL
jgi:hypothetical protein